jgi:HK97 family phage prohead protease
MTLDLLTRHAGTIPTSYDSKERTFEAVISTGAPVPRRDTRGQFDEVLDLSSIDVDALTGLPVLDGHRQAGSEHAVGTIISARREGNGLVAKVRLSAADDVKNIATKVSEGTLRGVSIGYSAASRTEGVQSGRRTVTVSPRIHELSIVSIPADPQAIIRNRKDVSSMTTENRQTAENENRQTADNDNVAYRTQVRAIARAAGQTAEWADQQIDSEADIVAVRAAAFEAMTTRQSPVIRTQTAAPANDDPNVILERRTAALFARVNGAKPEDAARQYFNDGLVDHARAFVTMSGRSVAGMDREQILRAAMHTTSDFSNLLTGVGNRTLMPAYQAAQSPLKALARQALHNDFRTASRLKLGEIGQLQKVTESGEIKSTSRGEAAESYALDSYGSLFALSRKAIINDDLGAFRDWGIAAGRAAAETEATLLWSLFSQSSGAGPVMGEDGKRLFHTDHGNLAASGSALADTSLSDARLALRSMKGLDGKTPISVVPKYLLVGPAKETAAEKLLTSITPNTADDVNPFAGKLTLLVEPRLAGNGWYVFADPASLAVLEYAYLSSAQGPQIASREGWDVLGMEFRVTLDFGCGPVDFRGAYRNVGE